MRPLAQRERRLIALGVLVALVLAVVLGVILPLVGGMAGRALERGDLTAAYSRNRRVLDRIPVWRAQATEQKATANDFALVAPTGALAAEMLKQRINRLASLDGGAVQTISEVQGNVPDGWVKVRADLKLTMGQLYKSLTQLESEAPYVVVDYLSVAAGGEKTGHGPMDVRLEILAPVRLRQPA